MKNVRISLRLDKETANMMAIIAKKLMRTTSDLIRFLIRQEFERGGYSLEDSGNGRPVGEDPCGE